MDAARLSASQAANQLGHAKVSMTQDDYFGRKVARTGGAEVLAIFDGNSVHTEKGRLILIRSPGQAADLGFCSSGWTRTNNPAKQDPLRWTAIVSFRQLS
jgi:hypothetical protein